MRSLLLSLSLFVCSSAAYAQSPTFEELAQQAQANIDANPPLAANLLKQALAIRPNWGEGWLYLGGSLYSQQRPSEALEAFDKGISLSPPLGSSWAFRGLCEFELKRYDSALDNFKQGESLGLGSNRPFEAFVRQHAALIYIHSSMFDDALAQLEPLSKISGETNPSLLEAAGLCALTLAKWPADLTAQQHSAVELAGKAQWFAMSRQPAEAEAAFKELLARYPDVGGVHYARGLFLLESDQDTALNEFTQELRINPKHWPSMLVAAALQNKRGDSDHAMETARTAAKLVPDQYLWLCHGEMGRAYLNLHEPDKAVPEFEAATKQSPSNPQMHFYLEQAYRLSGKTDAAKAEKVVFLRLKALQDPASLATKQ